MYSMVGCRDVAPSHRPIHLEADCFAVDCYSYWSGHRVMGKPVLDHGFAGELR